LAWARIERICEIDFKAEDFGVAFDGFLQTEMKPLMLDRIPSFGTRLENQNYQLRPGAYGIVSDGQQRIAVVRIPRGYFLPGGGIETGESAGEALVREIREECGYGARMLEELGQAMQFVHAQGEGYFAKHSTFFRALFDGPMEKPSELDHELLWLTPGEAIRKLKFPSQAWGVARALGIPQVACGVFIQDDKILLGKRSPQERICPNLWDLFGGHVEPDESPARALVRELQEELGIMAEEYVELQTMLEERKELGGPVAMYFYVVKRWSGQVKMLGQEHSEIRWFSIEEARHLGELAHPEYHEIFRNL
jgi:8-oxo-dGTP diphosphatase